MEHYVKMKTKWFQKAMEQYIDEFKPDPLLKRQLQSWTLQWKGDKKKSTTSPPSSSSPSQASAAPQQPLSFAPTHAMQGTLQVGGEHLLVFLKVECVWKPSGEQQDPQNGSLHFALSAQARFWTPSELAERQPPPPSTNMDKEEENKDEKKQAKIQEKIRIKMVERLRTDAYIGKILLLQEHDNNDNNHNYQLLAQADIQKNDTGSLEERVHVSDPVAEGVRRAIFSASTSVLDLVEVLINLPLLPCGQHQKLVSNTTPLADRAKLRLLEDAMLDQCEKEGEDDLIEELNIADDTKNQQEEEEEEEDERQDKRNKKNRKKSKVT
jgi:hypothetical protein